MVSGEARVQVAVQRIQARARGAGARVRVAALAAQQPRSRRGVGGASLAMKVLMRPTGGAEGEVGDGAAQIDRDGKVVTAVSGAIGCDGRGISMGMSSPISDGVGSPTRMEGDGETPLGSESADSGDDEDDGGGAALCSGAARGPAWPDRDCRPRTARPVRHELAEVERPRELLLHAQPQLAKEVPSRDARRPPQATPVYHRARGGQTMGPWPPPPLEPPAGLHCSPAQGHLSAVSQGTPRACPVRRVCHVALARACPPRRPRRSQPTKPALSTTAGRLRQRFRHHRRALVAAATLAVSLSDVGGPSCTTGPSRRRRR
jgi:hypothetical protein